MVYLKNFTILSREQEERILDSIRETCYTPRYPFNIFRYRDVPQLEFEPLTIFYGGNGSGKTTLLNIIAERLHLSRETVFNRSSFFEDYVRECSYKMTFGKIAPPGSRIITSDDVFDYLLDIRYVNQGIDTERVKLFDQYVSDKYEPFQLKGLDDYKEFKRKCDAKSKSRSRFIKERLMENVQEQSNGESGLYYFTNSIKENALYLLDEPENSLSASLQLKLKSFLEDSARFYHCQFIISTHSPFLLSMQGAKIYDLDSDPIDVKPWTQLENVKTYYSFFKSHEKEFF